MHQIVTHAELDALITGHGAVMVLFGGKHCGVCQAIKPRLARLAETEFPRLVAAWVDCQQGGEALCASQGVFSLPVLQLWFEGRPFDRLVRAFSLDDVRRAIERPYGLVFQGQG
ncbi:thioredoxin family protein [Marinobacter sp.]|uniref:thioredoxin family protein n=1 Tax=Marinobacter sp. TaxID=50741 RepID=UPI0035650F06